MAVDVPVPDDEVDAVQVRWERRPDHFLVRVTAPESAGRPGRVLESFTTILRWGDLRALADGVARRRSTSTDLGGFSYRDATEGSDTVVVFDGGDHEALVGRAAFERLFSRLLDTLVEGATADADPAVAELWWPDLVAKADALRLETGRGAAGAAGRPPGGDPDRD